MLCVVDCELITCFVWISKYVQIGWLLKKIWMWWWGKGALDCWTTNYLWEWLLLNRLLKTNTVQLCLTQLKSMRTLSGIHIWMIVEIIIEEVTSKKSGFLFNTDFRIFFLIRWIHLKSVWFVQKWKKESSCGSLYGWIWWCRWKI